MDGINQNYHYCEFAIYELIKYNEQRKTKGKKCQDTLISSCVCVCDGKSEALAII